MSSRLVARPSRRSCPCETDRSVDDYGQWRHGWKPGDPAPVSPPTFPAGQVWHKVKPGDTLSALARAYGTTPEAIKALNPDLITDINQITVGWNIRIK